MQSFNRVSDPVIDQDNAKIMGALGGGYGAWKHHANSIANRKGFLDRFGGRMASVGTRPVRSLVGAGLGALAAGTLARVVNKENKEDHQVNMAKAQAQPQAQPQYQMPEMSNYGMQRYAAENKTDKVIDSGIRGGLLGALANTMLGGKALKGAGIGALANASHELYKQKTADSQKDAESQTEANANYDAQSMERYAMEKQAFLKQLAKKALSFGSKAPNSKKLMSGGTSLKQEFMNNAPGVNFAGNSLKGASKAVKNRMQSSTPVFS